MGCRKKSERKERIWRVWDLDKGREEGWERLRKVCARVLSKGTDGARGHKEGSSSSSSRSSRSSSSNSSSSSSSGSSSKAEGVELLWKAFEGKVRRSLKEGVGEKIIVVREEIKREREMRVMITDENTKRWKATIRDVLNKLKRG